MKPGDTANRRTSPSVWLIFTVSAVSLLGLARGQTPNDPAFERWLKPHDWQRDSETPVLSLGEKGKFDDPHIFAPHVIHENGEFWMYYCGSQRCVDAGTYKGVAKDPAQPEKSDQRLFKLGLAKSKDGVHFTRFSSDPVFSFGDDVHSVVTAAILKNPDGSPHRENGQLRMYFAAVDFPKGTYKHELYETTSADGIHWAKPTLVMENAYAPCVMKEGGKYRMWYTWIDRHPWHTNHAESDDGTHWRKTKKPCIVCRSPAAAVEQPLLRHWFGPLERAGEVNAAGNVESRPSVIRPQEFMARFTAEPPRHAVNRCRGFQISSPTVRASPTRDKRAAGSVRHVDARIRVDVAGTETSRIVPLIFGPLSFSL